MSQYNPYLSQQPMMNNPYQNYSQPMQNPYMDRMVQLQQYQQAFQPQVQQPQGIIGRVVNDFNEITANDVPMNGSAAFFPKADGSELQVRSWTANGTIQTVIYRPIQAENSEQANIQQMDFSALNEDVRALREDIKGVREIIEKSMEASSPKTIRGKKAEVNSDE